jgi:hypothetical protein
MNRKERRDHKDADGGGSGFVFFVFFVVGPGRWGGSSGTTDLKRDQGFEEEPRMDTDAHGWIIPLEQHPGNGAKGSNQSMPLYQSVFIRVHPWFGFLLLIKSPSVALWAVFVFRNPHSSLNPQESASARWFR